VGAASLGFDSRDEFSQAVDVWQNASERAALNEAAAAGQALSFLSQGANVADTGRRLGCKVCRSGDLEILLWNTKISGLVWSLAVVAKDGIAPMWVRASLSPSAWTITKTTIRGTTALLTPRRKTSLMKPTRKHASWISNVIRSDPC
jgi:hypothetical protein